MDAMRRSGLLDASQAGSVRPCLPLRRYVQAREGPSVISLSARMSWGKMRDSPRRRHYVSPFTLVLLRPVLRYSPSRAAYVLRGIGGRVGPVLRREGTTAD
jgi:hypothetical protein